MKKKKPSTCDKSALGTKSLYISCAANHFCGTEYEIWVGFRPVGSTEIAQIKLKYATFKGNIFLFSWAKKVVFYL